MKDIVIAFLRAVVPAKFRSRLRAIFERVRYFGFRYKCPFCNSHLRKFLPDGDNCAALKEKGVIGDGYRPNVHCPVCGSFDRERLIYLYLQHRTNIFEQPQKLLHVAPEPTLKSILHKQANIDYLTADLIPKSVMVRMDLCNIRYPDNSFDAIICCHVLEHIVDDRKAISELYRILKPRGWAILQVPMALSIESTYEDYSLTCPSERTKAFGHAGHVRIYGRDYKDRLEQIGFSVDVFEWCNEKDSFGGQENKFGLIEKECVLLASKPA